MQLIEVTPAQREKLFNLNQKFLYEMTTYYPDDPDEHGNFGYGHFDAYFTDPARKAFFLCTEDRIVGFAMVHPYSYFGGCTDHVMAEFTIFPAYRGHHHARDAAALILSTYPGNWEIKFHEKNTGAKRLWTDIAAPYSPQIVHLNEEETVLKFTV